QLEPFPLPAPLKPPSIAGTVDENATHRLGSGGKKVPAAVEFLTADQAQIGLVNERGRAEGVTGGFRGHPGSRQFLQLVINEGKQFGGGPAVARLRRLQNSSEFRHAGSVYTSCGGDAGVGRETPRGCELRLTADCNTVAPRVNASRDESS